MRTPGEMMQGKRSLNTLRMYDLVPVSKLIVLPLGILYKNGQINSSFPYYILNYKMLFFSLSVCK